MSKPAIPNTFASLPFVERTGELYRISGGSKRVGWMFDEPAFLIYALIKFFKPELVIQTGHLWGKSALVMLEAMNDGFLGPAGGIEDFDKPDFRCAEFVAANTPRQSRPPKLISLDPFMAKHIPRGGEGINYLKQLHSNFEFYPMKSLDFFAAHAGRLKREYSGARIMGVVDGDHSWGGALYDMQYLADLGAQLIVVDDTIWLPHLGRLVREFAMRMRGYELLNLTLYTGTAIFWKRNFRVGPSKSEILPWTVREALYVFGGRRLLDLARAIRRGLKSALGL